MGNLNLDIDAVLRTLGALAERYGESSEEEQALRAAGMSLIFVQRTGQTNQLLRFFEEFDAPLSAIEIARSFGGQQEANDWLRGPEATPGVLVTIAGVTHVVANGQSGLMLVRTLSPEELSNERKS